MLLTKEETANIIPQKAPFVMIDSLLSANEKSFTASFIAEETNVFSKNNKLQEPALIENIAQTVAAGFSYIDRQNGGEPKIGFIGGISKLKIHQLPNIGDEITTTVTLQHQFENIYLMKGENFVNEKPLVECEMKIVVGI
jgi:predicted hotdog family 3-hydroxylacyl-ACP dehydratase